MKDEATPEMIEMAMKIGEQNTGNFVVHPKHGVRQLDEETIALIRQSANNAALAAIIETQRLDAVLAEDETGNGIVGMHIAHLIRAGHHYGKDSE